MDTGKLDPRGEKVASPQASFVMCTSDVALP